MESYNLFVDFYGRLQLKEHLDPVKRIELKRLAALINPHYQYKSSN